MSTPYYAEIRIFPYTFAPRNWAFCNGQVLAITQNTALFSILGTTYGGDGRSTFALPDLRGRAPIHWFQGPGLSPYDLGEVGGAESHTLTMAQAPAHSHAMPAVTEAATSASPGGGQLAVAVSAGNVYGAPTNMVDMALGGVAPYLNSAQPHGNMQAYLAINFCIALAGIFPSRN